jgi:hypothetical protein
MSGELMYIEVLDQPAEVIVVDNGIKDTIEVYTTVEVPVNQGAISVEVQGEVGSDIAVGAETIVMMPYNASITGWTILEVDENSCSIVIDVLKSDFASFPSFASIAGLEKPTISSGIKGQDLSLMTWDPIVSEGDFIKIRVESNTGAKNITLSLQLLKT